MLRRQALSATLWSGADVLLRQGFQFVVSIVLARLVTPDEFGTVALLSVFVGIANIFVDSGFSSALIQRKDVTHDDESTVFWFNLGMGTLVAALLWASGPWIASFFGRPVLVPITGVLALNVFVSALASIHRTLLTKRLEFRVLLRVGVVSAGVAGAASIAMAWAGFGVWALAAPTLLGSVVETALLWAIDGWRPTRTFRRESARRLFGFGGYLMGAALLDTAYSRGSSALIGKMYGVPELGLYNRAEGTKQLPVGVLTNVLTRVAFPVFSSAVGDEVRLRRGVRLAIRGIMLINVPMMLGLAAVADPLVVTLFGPVWRPAVPVLQVLCLGGVLWPLHVINLSALKAQGHSHLFFRLEVVKKTLGLAFLAGGAAFGVIGIASSEVAFSAAAFAINAHYTKRFLGYGPLAQLRDVAPILAVAAPMAAAVYGIGRTLALPPPAALFVLTAAGGALYFALGFAFRLGALEDAVRLVRERDSPERPAEAP